MQFRDLRTQYNVLKDEIDKEIKSVLENSNYILGEQVIELEKKLAEYVGVKHCITCASGTDALILSLMALQIGEGDAVFVPNFTYIATVSSEIIRGATPILVDIDKDTYNMSYKGLDEAIKKVLSEGKLKPKLVITVDLFGQCAEYGKIREITDKYGLKILEDGAQGFGGSIKGKKACSFGDIGVTSFFPAKPLGCYGDGGAIFTNDDSVDMVLRSLRSHGKSVNDKYDNQEIGINSRLDTIQAAILIPKLKAFVDYELDAVNRVSKHYTELLNNIVKTPIVLDEYVSSWAQYTILLKDEKQRDGLKEFLKSKGIPTMVYYPRGIHQQSAIIKMGYGKENFPVTEYVVKRCLSLPIHPYLKEDEIEFIAQNIINYMN